MSMTRDQLLSLVFLKVTTAPILGAATELPPAVFAESEAFLRRLNPEGGREDYHTSRLPELSRVTTVTLGGIRVDAGGVPTFSAHVYSHPDEQQLLLQVATALVKRSERGGYQLGGYGVRTFDVPFLTKRLWAQGLPLPVCLQLQGRKPWDPGLLDVSDVWSNAEWKQSVPLALFAQALNPALATELTPLLNERAPDWWYRLQHFPTQTLPEGTPEALYERLRHATHTELRVTMELAWQLASVSG